MEATKSLNDRLIPEGYELARQGAVAIPQQQQFAARHLDSEQGKDYLVLCLKVRESKVGTGQSLLDSVVRIIERK